MKSKILYIDVLTCFLSSCRELLEEDPRGLISADQFFSSVEEVELGVNGVYSGFFNDEFTRYGITPYLQMGTDETGIARPIPAVFNNGVYNFDASDGQILNLWIALYRIIKDANLVINRTEQSSINEADKDNYLGQVKFLRGLAYYFLATCWGDVPFWTDELLVDEVSVIGKTSSDIILDFVVQDMDDSESGLPSGLYGTNGRVTVWSAKMLKIKIHLWRGNWAEAKSESQAILYNSPHVLLDNFGDVFRSSNERNEEIIFGFEYMADLVRNHKPTHYRPRTVEESFNPGYFNGVGNYTLLKSFERSFVETDKRKAYSVLTEVGGNPLNFIYNPKNMEVPLPESDPLTDFATARGNHGKDEIVMRLGETFLMLAEAENELNGPTQVAYEAINEVRKRANLTDLTGLTQQQLRDSIRLERSRELLGEFFGRKLDLIRWGILVKTVQELPAKEQAAIDADPGISNEFKTKVMFDLNNMANLISEKHTVLPIPIDEIEKNPNITQHPLWVNE